MKKLLNQLKTLNDKYSINDISSGISFYIILSLISLLTLLIQISSFLPQKVQKFILVDIIKIVEEEASIIIGTKVYILSSIFLIISFIWSSSKVINGYLKASTIITKDKNKFIKRKIQSLIISIVFFAIFIIEFSLLVFGDYIIETYFNNLVVISIFRYLMEFCFIYFSIYLLYKLCFDYSVVLFSKTVKVTSIIIYVLLILLLISLNIIREIDYLYSTQLFLPLISIFIFLFNSVVIYGFCLNEETDNRKIWQE